MGSKMSNSWVKASAAHLDPFSVPSQIIKCYQLRPKTEADNT